MLIVIPARGGSQGVRRKNLLPIGNEPAFLRTARLAKEQFNAPEHHIIVATDDAEISAVAKMAGFEVFERGPELSEVGVNEVVRAVASKLNWAGEVMLIQPTVQPLTANILAQLYGKTGSDRSVALGIQERHQTWRGGERITPPLQRQESGKWLTREMGIRWWPKSDLIWHADTIHEYNGALVDIDTWADYESANHILDFKNRSTVTFVPVANSADGRGHLYRCLALAPLFGGHRVLFMPADSTEAWAIRLIHKHGWKTTVNPVHSDLVINDQLDMTSEQVFAQREWATNIVNLEDQGTGASVADLTINALGHSGGDWAVIRPEFLVGTYDLMREPSGKVLVLLNTDPTGMLQEVVEKLDAWFEVSYMVPSDVPLAVAMADTDVLVTSGGRTVFEAAALGVPTVVLPQHEREASHGHLGKGRNLVSTLDHVREDVEQLMVNRQLRVVLSANGRIDGLGGQRIAAACEWLMKGYGSSHLSSG